MSGPRIPIRVTAGVEILEESFIWEIKNFDVISRSNSMIDSQAMYFDVVDRDGQPSKWKVSLQADEVRGKRWVDIFYQVTKAPEAYDEDVFSNMDVTVKDKGGKSTWSGYGRPDSILGLRKQSFGYSKMIEADEKTVPETLEIHLSFQLYFPAKPTSKPAVSFQQPSLEIAQLNFAAKARQDLGEILQNPISGEVKIRSRDETEFRMPRGVLAARSPVFEAMLQTDMSEAKDGIITIPDIGGKALEVFLHFLYVGELLPSWKDTEVIAELTNAAAKYQLQDLLEFLDGMLGKICELENVATLFVLANQLSLKTAEGELLKFIREKGAGSAENFMQLDRKSVV